MGFAPETDRTRRVSVIILCSIPWLHMGMVLLTSPGMLPHFLILLSSALLIGWNLRSIAGNLNDEDDL